MTERRKRAILLATLAGVLLGTLDGTVTSTAMPRIVAHLHGEQSLTWVVTAYLLASTVTIPVYGRLADLYGRRNPLLTGLGLFLAGSALCATAQDMGQLIGFRVLQGIGAGALMTVGMTLVRDLYPPHRSGGMLRMQTLMAGMMVISFLGGPLAGGVITDSWGWRWIFLVNVPVGAVAYLVLARLVPKGVPGDESGRFDVAGVLLLTLGISLVLVGLTVANGLPITAVGVVGLVVFVLVERKADVPVVPLRLFGSRTYSAASLAGFLFTVGMMPVGLFIGLYFQQSLGYSATAAGLLVLPLMAGMIIGNRLTAALALRTGRIKGVLAAGAVLLAMGAAPLALLDNGIPLWITLTCTALIGIGTAPSMGGIMIVAQTAVDRRDVGSATAGLSLVKQLGGTAGLAIGQGLLSTQAIGWTIAVIGVACGLLALVAVLAMEDLDLMAARH
ncbi:EmrB/QacA subfamily drug resistance transporter [Kibdelosporangium banguiense]|uniref:EmrB/QacA subfamily drug resistance transporter n=1 Tax=Kibdelosporangium banguiense TaxID=1365924 RepID=A0ABS4U298_9PSEU|nr:MDR family MFS transporter [Kibdelosporangium banguiense]MBP2330783.1 EmrB/QacA subfamily drug resistance transporter [Kibdelosporangium banguiense]